MELARAVSYSSPRSNSNHTNGGGAPSLGKVARSASSASAQNNGRFSAFVGRPLIITS